MVQKVKLGVLGLRATDSERLNFIQLHFAGMEIIAAHCNTQSDMVFAKNTAGLQYVYSEVKQLTENHDIDAILIWSDASDHGSHMLAAIQSNKHVFVDLPLATNVSDTEMIIKAAKGRPSQSTFCPLENRFNPIFKTANQIIDSGELGVPILAQLYHGKKKIKSDSEDLNLKPSSIFTDLALNEIDLISWFFGKKIKQVKAVGTIAMDKSLKLSNDVDTAQIQLTLSDAQFVQMSLSRFPINNEDSRFFIQGTKSSILIDNQGLKLIHEKGIDHRGIQNVKSSPYGMDRLTITDFYEQITQRKRPLNTLEDVAYTTKVAVAMARSLVMGEEVTIS